MKNIKASLLLLHLYDAGSEIMANTVYKSTCHAQTDSRDG